MTRTLRALLGVLGIAIVALIAWLTPHVSGFTRAVLGLLSAVTIWYVWRWPQLEMRLAAAEDSRPAGSRAVPASRTDPASGGAVSTEPGGRDRLSGPRPFDLAVGFITNFFDTLGIGNFAPTTAALKFTRRIPDEDIPGTLNVGHALPVLTEALIFIAAIVVDPRLLIAMIVASILGAWLGAGVVARMPRRAIQVGMGTALAIAAVLFMAANLHWMPVGGSATAFSGTPFLVAVAGNFFLGALMTLGIGLYAPCLIMLSLLGLDPRAAFPIMMGSCAFLMPVGGVRFVRSRRYSSSVALGLAIGGPPAVLIAGYLVKSMPLVWLRWLVVCVVLYAAVMMLTSALRRVPLSSRAALVSNE
ncbi:MAG TPA: sulfite exporter TauE/SafE family protein [Steroidobacteraceae bacterium]|nr:sulfite exporter TauE/SafE family protein [Steroidobacteraceae bacterium]